MGLREKKVLARTMPMDLFVVRRRSVLSVDSQVFLSSLNYQRHDVEIVFERWHELFFTFSEDGSE